MSVDALTAMGLRRHPPASVHPKCTPDPSRMQLRIGRRSFHILPLVLRPDHELRAISIDPPKRGAFVLPRRFAKPKVGPGLCEYLSQPCRIHSISLLKTKPKNIVFTGRTTESPAINPRAIAISHVVRTIMLCKARYAENSLRKKD
jgi:hypothetical protein